MLGILTCGYKLFFNELPYITLCVRLQIFSKDKFQETEFLDWIIKHLYICQILCYYLGKIQWLKWYGCYPYVVYYLSRGIDLYWSRTKVSVIKVIEEVRWHGLGVPEETSDYTACTVRLWPNNTKPMGFLWR